MYEDETGTLPRNLFAFQGPNPAPALLVVRALAGSVTADRFGIGAGLTIGRGKGSGFVIADPDCSRTHVEFSLEGGECWIDDLKSKNGTYVNDQEIKEKTQLKHQSVIRLGHAILVFHEDARELNVQPATMERLAKNQNLGFVGDFHSERVLETLIEATATGRGLLLVGASGSGKEVAAQALGRLLDKEMVVQNAARFSSKDEAMSTIFGVGQKVFSGVEAKPGYLEKADGGLFFLDEVHNLPVPVQKGLLRVLEEGELARIGQTETVPVDVQFVFASNEPPSTYGLAHDLLNRLTIVEVPSLKDRLADIPSIFDHVLADALKKTGLDLQAEKLLHDDFYEAMMLDGFETSNVRGLIDLAGRIVGRINSGLTPDLATKDVFSRRYRFRFESPNVDYQDDTETDIESAVREAYYRFGGNVTAIQRALKNIGIKLSRKKLGQILDKLGLVRIKRPRK